MDILTPKRIGSGLMLTLSMNIGMLLTEPVPHSWTLGSFDFQPDPVNSDKLYADVRFNEPVTPKDAEAATESEIIASQSDVPAQGRTEQGPVESASCKVTATRQHATAFILNCNLYYQALST